MIHNKIITVDEIKDKIVKNSLNLEINRIN